MRKGRNILFHIMNYRGSEHWKKKDRRMLIKELITSLWTIFTWNECHQSLRLTPHLLRTNDAWHQMKESRGWLDHVLIPSRYSPLECTEWTEQTCPSLFRRFLIQVLFIHHYKVFIMYILYNCQPTFSQIFPTIVFYQQQQF